MLCERDVVRGDIAAVGEDAADRHVGAAVLPGEADAHDLAVRQADAAGALDLQHKGRDGVGEPGDGQVLARQRAGGDLGAGEIGLEAPVLHAAGDDAPGEIPAKSPRSICTRSGGRP